MVGLLLNSSSVILMGFGALSKLKFFKCPTFANTQIALKQSRSSPDIFSKAQKKYALPTDFETADLCDFCRF